MTKSVRRRKGAPGGGHPAAALITKITEENRSYRVQVQGMAHSLHAWRVGYDWYHGTGEFLTTSANITSIRVAARTA